MEATLAVRSLVACFCLSVLLLNHSKECPTTGGTINASKLYVCMYVFDYRRYSAITFQGWPFCTPTKFAIHKLIIPLPLFCDLKPNTKFHQPGVVFKIARRAPEIAQSRSVSRVFQRLL